MASNSFAIWLVTLSAIVLMRQKLHDELTIINSWPTTFDFIVVGAGNAGSLVARRLAEDPRNFKVLLLEAGGAESVISDIPSMTQHIVASEMNWNYKSAPQQWSCFGYAEGRCPLPRGKVLGGTSVLSWMNVIRGSQNDYDNWASEFGLNEWSWDNVMGYFMKWENNTEPMYSNGMFHNNSGPQIVSSIHHHANDIFNQWISGGNKFGYPVIPDLNGIPMELGSNFSQKFMHFGKRMSSATSFLEPIKSKPNLHIITNAFVTQILFNDFYDKNRASGMPITCDSPDN